MSVAKDDISLKDAFHQALVEGREVKILRAIHPQPPHLCRYEINGAGSHALCLHGHGANMLFVPPLATSADYRLPCPFGKAGDRIRLWEWGADYFANLRTVAIEETSDGWCWALTFKVEGPP